MLLCPIVTTIIGINVQGEENEEGSSTPINTSIKIGINTGDYG